MTDLGRVRDPSPDELFAAARDAQQQGKLQDAERGYVRVLAAQELGASVSADILKRTRWNLATIYEGRDEFQAAVELLQPLHRTPTGELDPDVELHIRRAQLRFKQFEAQAAIADLGSALPTFTNGCIKYEPLPLATLREGVRAYRDVQKLLAIEGVRAALGEETAAQYAMEAETGVFRGIFTRASFAGTIQEAAVGRIATANRDALVARLRAKNQRVPEYVLGRQGITEGPYADAMEARTRQLLQDVRATGRDDTDYVSLWQQWLSESR